MINYTCHIRLSPASVLLKMTDREVKNQGVPESSKNFTVVLSNALKLLVSSSIEKGSIKDLISVLK